MKLSNYELKLLIGAVNDRISMVEVAPSTIPWKAHLEAYKELQTRLYKALNKTMEGQ